MSAQSHPSVVHKGNHNYQKSCTVGVGKGALSISAGRHPHEWRNENPFIRHILNVNTLAGYKRASLCRKHSNNNRLSQTPCLLRTARIEYNEHPYLQEDRTHEPGAKMSLLRKG